MQCASCNVYLPYSVYSSRSLSDYLAPCYFFVLSLMRHRLTVACKSLYYANLTEHYRIVSIYNLLMRLHADVVTSQCGKFFSL